MLRRDDATGIFMPVRKYTMQAVHHPAIGQLADRAKTRLKRAWFAWFAAGTFVSLLLLVPWQLALVGAGGAYLSRHHFTKLLLIIPAILFALGTLSLRAGLLHLGGLVIARIYIGLQLAPDKLEQELHLAAAAYTKMPTTERHWRLEGPMERFNRKTAGQYDKAKKMHYPLLIPAERTTTHPEKWTQITYRDGTTRRQRGKTAIARLRHQYGPDFHDTDPAVRRNLTRHMAGAVGQDLRATWQTDENWVVWEPLGDLPDRLLYAQMPKVTGVMTLGVGDANGAGVTVQDDQALVTQDLDTDPHTLVAGKTRSGKTAFSRVRVAEHQRVGGKGLRMLLWDGKRGGAFTYLEDQDGIEVTTRPEGKGGGLEMVRRTKDEMERRYTLQEQAKRARRPVPRFPRWVLVIDEYMSVMDDLAPESCKEDREELLTSLALISRKGGECRVSLELYTQRPDVQGVSGAGVVGQMRDQFYKVQIGQGTKTLSTMLFQDANLGMSIPALPRGRAGVLNDNGDEVIVFQTPFLPDPLAEGVTFADVVEGETETVLTDNDDDTIPRWITERLDQQAAGDEEIGRRRRRQSGPE